MRKEYVTGIIVSITIGILSIFLSKYIPVVGSSTIALIIGISINIKHFKTGSRFIEKRILPIAIALMGLTISFETVKNIGLPKIALIVLIMVITILSSILLGNKILKDNKKAILIGTGNAVCGSSAILATSKVVGTSTEDTGVTVAVINLLGVLGLFLIPFISKIFGFDLFSSSFLIGSTLQSVGNVVASSSFVPGTLELALIIKMIRVSMLSVVLLIYSIYFKNNKHNKGLPVPLFMIIFIIFMILSNLNVFPQIVLDVTADVYSYLILISMAAIGLNIDLKNIVRLSKETFVVAFSNWVVQVILALIISIIL